MKEKRLFELSAMNILLCLMVIFIHVTSEPVTGYMKNSFPYAVVCIAQRGVLFVVQGFIFLSGLKLMKSKNRERSYFSFCWDRFRRILLPYLLWVLIYYGYFIRIGWMSFDWGELLRYIFVGNLVSPFYFVVIITQFYLLTPLWRRLTERCAPVPLCLGALAVMLPAMRYLPRLLAAVGISGFAYNDRVFTTYLFYWVAGCVAGKHYDRFRAWVTAHGKWILAAWAGAFCVAVLPYWRATVQGRAVPWLSELHVLYCVCAILCLFWVSTRIPSPEGKRAEFLRTLDHSTYLIFLTHCLPLQMVNRRLSAMGVTSITIRYIVRILVVYAVSIGLCMLWQWGKTQLQTRKMKEE